MSKQPTIADVAKAAGYSRATISLVLADSPQIPQHTKERVRATMAEMGYVYNRLAGMVRGGRSHTIGLVLTNIRNPYFAELSMSVDAAARDAGYTLIQGYSFGDAEREKSLIRVMKENRVDGLLVLAVADTDVDAFDTHTEEPSLVALLRKPLTAKVDFVGVAESASGTLLGSHLAKRGVRSAAFLGGTSHSRIREDRIQGLRIGLGTPEALPDSATLYATHRDDDFREATRLVDQLIESHPIPDAIVAYNDSWAGGIYHGLKNHGIEPGIDVAIASFDNIPLAQQMQPPLTTIDTDPWKVGSTAVRIVVDRIADPQRKPECVLIEPRLIERASTLSWQSSANHLPRNLPPTFAARSDS